MNIKKFLKILFLLKWRPTAVRWATRGSLHTVPW
jgi:hypothetical protein